MRGAASSLLLVLSACTGQGTGLARLELGSSALPEGVDRLSLLLAGPDLLPREVEVDPDALTFEIEIPAGPARTLTLLAEHETGPVWAPWYWGLRAFDLGEGEVLDLVVPAVPAGRVEPIVLLDGLPRADALVTTTLVDPDEDLPAVFEDPSDGEGNVSRVVPAGGIRFEVLWDDADTPLCATTGTAQILLAQGETVSVPLALVPLPVEGIVDHLEIALGGQVQVGDAVDLVVRVVDTGGGLVESFDGVVELIASDPTGIALPTPYRFDPAVDAGEHVFPGGLRALAAVTGVEVLGRVQDEPAIEGSRTLDVLDVGETVGAAVRFVVELLGDLEGGLLAQPVDLRVTAVDAEDRVATGYRGLVTFADSDLGLLALPADTRFTDEDAGVHRFDAGLLPLLGTTLATVRVHDVDDPSIAGLLDLDLR